MIQSRHPRTTVSGPLCHEAQQQNSDTWRGCRNHRVSFAVLLAPSYKSDTGKTITEVNAPNAEVRLVSWQTCRSAGPVIRTRLARRISHLYCDTVQYPRIVCPLEF